MATITINNFVTCLKKSRVIDSERLDQWLAAAETENVTELAAKLVRDELLTSWQAKYLLSGRSRLDIGSYRLLERIQRDELGDRFLAIHTQLGRKVDIQILPADLTSDKDRCEAFIRKASQSAKLDHPNLIHVYDIDQEGGRYFLVTEHVEGVTLDQAPRESLFFIDVARLVNRAIAGLQFAHENEVNHGDVTQHDLVIGTDRTIKVQNIAVSPIRSVSKQVSEDNDFQAIAKIGRTLLNEIALPDVDNHRASLKTIFDSMLKGDDESVQHANEQLSGWLADFDDENFSYPVAPGGAFENPVVSSQANSSNTDMEEEEEFEEESPGLIARMGRDNPVALLATGLAIGFFSISLGGWIAYAMFLKPTETTQNISSNENRSDATNVALKPPIESKPDEQAAQIPDFSDTKAMQQLIAQTLDSTQGSTDESDTVVPAKSKSSPDKKSGKNLSTPSAKDVSTANKRENKPRNKSNKSEPPKNTSKKEPETTVKTEKATPTSKPKSKPAEPVVDANPFKKFPSEISLPPLDDVSERKIGDLVISDRFLLGLEIVAHADIAKTTLIFDLNRDASDKQKWTVTVKRREKETGDEIATFRKSESEFFFQWLPDAENHRYAGYLQNCQLKLKVPTDETFLMMREPVLLEPMTLTAETLSSEVETQLKFLPNPDSISAEILDSKIAGTSLNPSQIDPVTGVPGRILLMEKDKDAFVYVQVAVDIRSKLKVRSDLVILTNGVPQPLNNMQALEGLIGPAQQLAMLTASQYQAAKAKRAPKGQGEAYDQIRSQLDKAAKSAAEQATQIENYVNLAPKVLDQPISIRIYANFDGHHIELARTQPTK